MPSTFSAETMLFGIGISFQSNHPGALRRALSAFPPPDGAVSSCPQSVRIILIAKEGNGPAPDSHRIEGTRLEVTEQGVTVKADGERSCGICNFHPAAVDTEPFASGINTVVLFLVAQRGRIPLHASAVIVHGQALVLAGKSGTGKSALARAADRVGLPVLSEDTVFVQLEPSFCVWGRPEVVHLSEMDVPVGDAVGIRIRSGRVKRVIPIVHRCPRAERAMLILLTNGDRVIFHRLDPEDAVRALSRNPEPGYQLFGARLEAAIRALAANGCWQLNLSADPNEAIAELVRAVSSPAASEAG